LNAWNTVPGFNDIIKTWWNSYSEFGNYVDVLKKKLKMLKCDKKSWNKEIFEITKTNK